MTKITETCNTYKEAIASPSFRIFFANILEQIDEYNNKYYLSIIDKINKLNKKTIINLNDSSNENLNIYDFLTSKEEDALKELFENDEFNELANTEFKGLKPKNLDFSQIGEFVEKFNVFWFKQKLIEETTKSNILKALFEESNKNTNTSYEIVIIEWDETKDIIEKFDSIDKECKQKYLWFKKEWFKKFYEIVEEEWDFIKIKNWDKFWYLNKKTWENYWYFDDVHNILETENLPKLVFFIAKDEWKYRIIKTNDPDYMKDEKYDNKPELYKDTLFAKIKEGDKYYYQNLISGKKTESFNLNIITEIIKIWNNNYIEVFWIPLCYFYINIANGEKIEKKWKFIFNLREEEWILMFDYINWRWKKVTKKVTENVEQKTPGLFSKNFFSLFEFLKWN